MLFRFMVRLEKLAQSFFSDRRLGRDKYSFNSGES